MLYVRACGEVEELVMKAVWNSGTNAGALRLVPNLDRRTVQSLVAVDALTLAGVGVVHVLFGVAMVRLHATLALAFRVLL